MILIRCIDTAQHYIIVRLRQQRQGKAVSSYHNGKLSACSVYKPGKTSLYYA